MDEYQDQIQQLLDQAAALEDGPAQVGLIEEAMRLADTHNDLDLAFAVRLRLISAAGVCQPELATAAFSWCLAQCDDDPERFPIHQMLWYFRLVIHALPLFPQIPRSQIESLLDDMATRYRRAGASLRGVHLLRRNVAVRMGDFKAAAIAHTSWQKAPQGWLGDSPETELNFLVEYLSVLEKDDEALAKAAPVLAGKMRVSPVPENTYAEVLLPLLRLNRPEEAMAYHQKGYRMIARQLHSFIEDFREHHIPFLVLTGNEARALKLFEKLLPVALSMAALAHRWQFYLAARLLLDSLKQEGKETLKLRLPQSFPLHNPKGQYGVTELTDWFTEQLGDLARRFDARNGNDDFQRRIEELPALLAMRKPFPLPKRG